MAERPVKTVVFDVGKVLIEWDPRHLYAKIFDDPGRMEWFLAEVCPPEWNVEQDRGRSAADAEAEAIARHPDLEPEIRAFYGRFQEMIPHAIDGTVETLRRLKDRGYPLYGLTNFAADTFPGTRERFDFFAEFDGIVVSGVEKVIKPDPAIYRILLERYDLDPASTIFVDDSPHNVASAEALGIRAHRFEEPDAMKAWMRDLGLPV